MFYTECIAESGFTAEKTTGMMKKVYVSEPCARISVVLASKNGIDLVCVELNEKPLHYELYMDGALLNKFKNEKTARLMFKDFSAD